MRLRNVWIDGYNLALPHGTGVATYAFALASALKGMDAKVSGVFGLNATRRPETREALFFEHFGRGDDFTRRSMRAAVRNWFLAPWRSPGLLEVADTGLVERRHFAQRLPKLDNIYTYPFLFQIAKAHFSTFGRFLELSVPNPPDVMHWTYPLPVKLRNTRNIYTLHDLVPLRLPYTTEDDKKYYYKLISTCVHLADHICTVSEASRNDIVSRFPHASDKVSNTYQTSPIPGDVVDRSVEYNASAVETQFGLRRKEYFLFFGAVDPKKNIPRIIEAYLTANIETPLVIVASRDLVSKDGKSKDRTMDRLLSGTMDRRIRLLEYLPRATLFRLAQSAKAVLFPSLYEGFGLPALEAIQLGTPVLSSQLSSLPEVIGDAGYLVDPYSTEQISDAIRLLDEDSELRERLIAAGPAQSCKFSVESYQSRLSAMYDKIV